MDRYRYRKSLQTQGDKTRKIMTPIARAKVEQEIVTAKGFCWYILWAELWYYLGILDKSYATMVDLSWNLISPFCWLRTKSLSLLSRNNCFSWGNKLVTKPGTGITFNTYTRYEFENNIAHRRFEFFSTCVCENAKIGSINRISWFYLTRFPV